MLGYNFSVTELSLYFAFFSSSKENNSSQIIGLILYVLKYAQQ